MARRTPNQLEERANAHVAERIRNRRHELDVTQEALAHEAGVHRTFIGRIERHEVNMTLGTLALLADALDTTVAHLVEGI